MAEVFTYDDKAKALALARLSQESVVDVAKSLKVSPQTIYMWSRKAGLALGKKTAAKKAGKVAKKKAQHANGNGASVSRDPLAQVERELSAALERVRKVRAAMATVFGA